MFDFLVYGTVLFLPLYLVRFSIFGLPTNVLEVLIGLTFVGWIFRLKKTAIRSNLPKIYQMSFLLLFSGLVLSAALNPNLFQAAGIIKGWFVFPFVFFLILSDRLTAPEKREQILRILFVSSSTVGLISLFYLLAGRLTFDGRLQAFYLSPNHLAMVLVPGIIIGLSSLAKIFLLKIKRDISFYFPALGTFVLLIALYFTFSYGAWLALFSSLSIALCLSNLMSRSQKIRTFGLVVFLLILLFSFQLSNQKLESILKLDERSSLASRTMIWKAAWAIGQDHPLWGIGPGNFQAQYLAYQKYFPPYLEWAVPQPHNLYLAFWLQTGILGLIGFLVLVGAWLARLVSSMTNKKDGFLEAALLAIMLSILLHGLIDTPYWKNDLALLFWIVIALGLRSDDQA